MCDNGNHIILCSHQCNIVQFCEKVLVLLVHHIGFGPTAYNGSARKAQEKSKRLLFLQQMQMHVYAATLVCIWVKVHAFTLYH